MQKDTRSPFGINQVQVRFDGDNQLRATAGGNVYQFNKTLQRRLQKVDWQIAVELVQNYPDVLIINHPDADKVLQELKPQADVPVETSDTLSDIETVDQGTKTGRGKSAENAKTDPKIKVPIDKQTKAKT